MIVLMTWALCLDKVTRDTVRQKFYVMENGDLTADKKEARQFPTTREAKKVAEYLESQSDFLYGLEVL